MFKRLAVLTLALLLLASCAPEAALPTRPVDSVPPPVVDNDGEAVGDPEETQTVLLTVSGPEAGTYSSDMLYQHIAAFTALHPDVTIRVHHKTKSGSNHATAIATELMGGQGDDLIYTSGLPYVQWARLGMFVDLSGYLDREPGMREDFYPNMLDAFTVDDGLYALPKNVAFPTYGVSPTYSAEAGRILGEQTTMTQAQLMEVFHAIRASAPALRYPGNYFTADSVTAVELSSFYNRASGYVNFGQDYIDMIKGLEEYLVTDPNNPPSEGAYLAQIFLGFSGLERAVRFLPGSKNRVWAVADQDGGVYLWFEDTYAINANSKNQELAWEFLNFMNSNEGRVLARDTSAVPVRRSILHGAVLEDAEFYRTTPQDAQRAVEAIEALFETFRGYTDSDTTRGEILMAAVDDYNAGLITAEQLAARLQEKLTLYVNQ